MIRVRVLVRISISFVLFAFYSFSFFAFFSFSLFAFYSWLPLLRIYAWRFWYWWNASVMTFNEQVLRFLLILVLFLIVCLREVDDLTVSHLSIHTSSVEPRLSSV